MAETEMKETRISKMMDLFGGKIYRLGEGHARGVLPLTELVMQPTRVYHAGAIISLADEVASAALSDHEGDTDPTISKLFPYSIAINTNLLTNDPVGPITAEAFVVRRGRVAVVETKVMTSTGQLMTMVTSSHLMVDPKKTGPHLKPKLQEK
jgi:uncharacterized protein (TIGR00369 family)